MRWTLLLLALVGCGAMCFGGVVLAALGLRRTSRTTSGRSSHGPAASDEARSNDTAEL